MNCEKISYLCNTCQYAEIRCIDCDKKIKEIHCKLYGFSKIIPDKTIIQA